MLFGIVLVFDWLSVLMVLIIVLLVLLVLIYGSCGDDWCGVNFYVLF